MRRVEVRVRWLVGALCLAGLAACESGADPLGPGGPGNGPDPVPPPVDLSRVWATSTAAAEGFDPDLLEAAFAEAEGAVPNLRSLVAVRNGRLVALGDIGFVLRDAGYGYQTWSDRQGGGGDVSAFVMWGYGGQFAWVVPNRQLVVVAQTHWRGIGDRNFEQAGQVADRVVRPVIEAARPIRP